MDGNYVAMVVTLIIWVGLFVYLMRLDKRVKDLERYRK
jgi:CcmD family protein